MENYLRLEKEIENVIDDQALDIGNLNNVCSIIYHSLPNINWAGIYLLKGESLYLGPFIGKVACTRISLNKGICGRAITNKANQFISDVSKECDHIACDINSKSEAVLILHRKDKLFGVLDIDANICNRFDDILFQEFLIKVSRIIEHRILNQ